MNALAELKKRASNTATNRAISANRLPSAAPNSQESLNSLGALAEKYLSVSAASTTTGLSSDPLKQLRVHLQALAASEGIVAGHVRCLNNADLAVCIGLDERQLVAYLSMLSDTADRHSGRVPTGDTAAIRCERCGPVWVHPSIAEVLPVVDEWPRALGCPWCFVRKAGGRFPRPRALTRASP